MLRYGRNEGTQCLVDLFGGRKYFCYVRIEHHYQWTVFHTAGKAVGFGFLIIEPVFGGHIIRDLTRLVCGRFFHVCFDYIAPVLFPKRYSPRVASARGSLAGIFELPPLSRQASAGDRFRSVDIFVITGNGCKMYRDPF